MQAGTETWAPWQAKSLLLTASSPHMSAIRPAGADISVCMQTERLLLNAVSPSHATAQMSQLLREEHHHDHHLRDVCMQTGSLLLNAVSPSQVTIQVPQALSGFNTVLNASSLTTSPVAAGAGCMYIAFASSVPVDAFLSTYDDFVSLVTDKCASCLLFSCFEFRRSCYACTC